MKNVLSYYYNLYSDEIRLNGENYYFKSNNENYVLFLYKNEIHKLIIYAAFIENKIVGVLAMRESHISLFFVNKNYHRQGVGRSLFKVIKEDYRGKKITVNSSPYAVNIYKKLGFAAKDHEQVTNGIRYTPMIYAN